MISLPIDQIEKKFCKLPLLKGCSRAALARAIPYLEERFLKAGETLVEKGQAATQLYVIVEGRCALQQPGGPLLVEDVVGEETLIGVAYYHANVTATTDCRVLVLSQVVVAGFLREDPALLDSASQHLLQTHGNTFEKGAPQHPSKRTTWVSISGWMVTLLLPVFLLVFGARLEFGHNALLFLCLLSVTLSMWMFRLVPEYVPGLFVIAATMGLGLAPAKVALSGFVSDAFFLAMSVLGVGAVITASGLSYRFLLWLLRLFPQNQFGFNLSVATTGLLLTPVVPAIIGRVALVAPLMSEMMKTLRLRKEGVAATLLAASTFNGLTLLSAVFLTSKASNFLILAMMPSQTQGQFQMVDWFLAGSVAGVVMLVLYAASLPLFFRNQEKPVLTRAHIQGQLNLLGPMQVREWAALASILLFAIGVVTFSIHQIPPAWIGLGLMCFLLAMGFLGAEEFSKQIDWPFLLFFGATMGLIGTLNYLNLDKTIIKNLYWIGEYMIKDFPVFLALLIGAMLLVRIVMPIGPATVIFASVFIALADNVGLNPWVVGFAVLMLSELWVLPYQCHYYLQFEEIAGPRAYSTSLMLKHNVVISLIKIAALYASIPYWKYLNIL